MQGKTDQVFNPFLPAEVCIPDGEPHVFGDRVYLFGSHDKPGGGTFCMLPYEIWSTPVDDLSEWSSKGVNYRAEQDPHANGRKYCFASDCVRGKDGRKLCEFVVSSSLLVTLLSNARCAGKRATLEFEVAKGRVDLFEFGLKSENTEV